MEKLENEVYFPDEWESQEKVEQFEENFWRFLKFRSSKDPLWERKK